MSSHVEMNKAKMSEEVPSPTASASSLSSSSSSLSSSSKSGGQMKRQNVNGECGAGDAQLPTTSSEVKPTVDVENGCKRRRRSGVNNNDDADITPPDTDSDSVSGALEGIDKLPESSISTSVSDQSKNKTENSVLLENMNEPDSSKDTDHGISPSLSISDLPELPDHPDLSTETPVTESSLCNTDNSKQLADGNAGGANDVAERPQCGTSAASQRQCRIRQRSYRRTVPEMSSNSGSPVREEANNENVPDEDAHQSDDSDDFSLARFVMHYESHSSVSNDDLNSLASHDVYDPSSDGDSSMEEDNLLYDEVESGEGRKSYVHSVVDKVLNKNMSECKWNTTTELIRREHGMFGRSGSSVHSHSRFNTRFYASQYVVERMERSHVLKRHSGCVNSLNFDRNGDFLCSGSDDKRIIIWDWTRNKFNYIIKSGHRENIFQTKFIAGSAGFDIVSAGRDGQVRRSIITSSGKPITTCLYKHRNAVHKLVLCPSSPNEILSVGEDGYIRHCDLRSIGKGSLPLLKVVNNAKPRTRVRLFSIAHHPYSPEVCVCGSDEYVLIYDKRKFDEPVHKMCPSHLANMSVSQVTCCTYNYNGSEILATYSDEQIYLFNNRNYEAGSFMHVYRGHYNHRTIKGVNFFGPNSEYVISGSDCGNVFFWDKETEAIVNFMPADPGSVNCLEPHPTIPVLATSGLDYTVKVWAPGSNVTSPEKDSIKSCIMRNIWRSGMEGRGQLLDSAFNDIILEAFHPGVFDSDDSISDSSPINFNFDHDHEVTSTGSSSDSSIDSPFTDNNDHQYHAHESDDDDSDSEVEIIPLGGGLTCRTQ